MSEIYETRKLVDEYLLFHYGTEEQILPRPGGPRDALGFPERTVAAFSPGQVSRALDVGCAVGRSSFELARQADEVIGVDFSEAFIEAAIGMKDHRTARCELLEEGHLTRTVDLSYPDGAIGQVRFEVGDAMNLRMDLGQFDRVHAANLVCRLPEPRRFLSRLADLVSLGGELVLATPCTWLEEFTAKENWPPGRTLEWLEGELAPNFQLAEVRDEPFLIRETARKFQWTTSLVSRWKRD